MQNVSTAFLASLSTAKNKYCCFNKKLNNTRPKLKTSVKFSFLLKQQYLFFAVDNDARKAVETFCIYSIRSISLALIFMLKIIHIHISYLCFCLTEKISAWMVHRFYNNNLWMVIREQNFGLKQTIFLFH